MCQERPPCFPIVVVVGVVVAAHFSRVTLHTSIDPQAEEAAVQSRWVSVGGQGQHWAQSS